MTALGAVASSFETSSQLVLRIELATADCNTGVAAVEEMYVHSTDMSIKRILLWCSVRRTDNVLF